MILDTVSEVAAIWSIVFMPSNTAHIDTVFPVLPKATRAAFDMSNSSVFYASANL